MRRFIPLVLVVTVFVFGLIFLLAVRNFFSTDNTSPGDNFPKIDTTSSSSRYLDYSQALYVNTRDKKRVLFFHAKWCPTCKAADAEFLSNLDKIPQDVVVFKTDYDSETALKKKYGITYQHTFVYVDQNGNEIKKWNGGGLAEIVANTK